MSEKTPRIHTDRYGNKLVIFSKRHGTKEHPVTAWYLDSLITGAVLIGAMLISVLIGSLH